VASVSSNVYVRGCKAVARTVYGNSDNYEVKVGTCQGLAISTLLFLIVMEALALLWELRHADDLVVIAVSKERRPD